MTRTRWMIAIALPLAVLLVLPAIGFAGTNGGVAPRNYKGTTSQGRRARFRTVRTAAGWGLKSAEFELLLRCEDGTKMELGAGFGWGSPITLDSRNRFAFDDNFSDEAVHIHGRLGANAGTGTVEFTLATLNKQEQAQTCTSKQRDWTVERVVTPTPTPSPTPTAVAGTSSSHLSMEITVDARGRAHVTRSWS